MASERSRTPSSTAGATAASSSSDRCPNVATRGLSSSPGTAAWMASTAAGSASSSDTGVRRVEPAGRVLVGVGQRRGRHACLLLLPTEQEVFGTDRTLRGQAEPGELFRRGVAGAHGRDHRLGEPGLTASSTSGCS